MYAAASLGQIGSDAGEAVEPLIELVRHEPDLQVILVAIEALGRIGPAARPAIPVLASIAKNPQHWARVWAALALWRIGSEGRTEASVVVPTLINQLATEPAPSRGLGRPRSLPKWHQSLEPPPRLCGPRRKILMRAYAARPETR